MIRGVEDRRGANLYKDLVVWRLSVNLIKDIYKIADSLPKSEEARKTG